MQQVVTKAPATGYSRGPAWNQTSIGAKPAARTGLLPAGPSCQPCPDCGGLECLCRPRFFAGQLLSEQDLNRLDQYIVAKNQLHNRYLVGHGVVCGLEVKCSPCANTVNVSSGYAIDTCGNDIIVCSPDVVDICKLIKACTPATQVDCAPYKDNTLCKDLEQEWILAIRYQETPSRGITPLTGASQCSCGSLGSCSCGSAVTKACGCGSMMPAASCCGATINSTAPVSTNLPRRGAPPACEPTVTCEAYRYEVFLAPTKTTTPAPSPVRGLGQLAGTIGGELFERIACCVQTLMANLSGLPGTLDLNSLASRTEWSNFCCALRQSLIQYLIMHGGNDCQAIAKLQAVACPSPDSQSFVNDLGTALVEEFLIFAELLIDCVCSAALPPCPAPGDPRVPLASVKIRASDCTIISVCDWTLLRKHVVTTKTLGYWLGWLPYVPLLRAFMQQVCCAILGLPDQLGRPKFQMQAVAAGAGSQDGKGTPQGLDAPVVLGAQSYQASNPISDAIATNLAGGVNALKVSDLMQALFDPVDPGAPTDRLAATPHVKVLAEIARPLVTSFGSLFRAASGNAGQEQAVVQQAAARQAADATTTVAAMREELDTLKTTVATQQAALDALRQPPQPPAPARRNP